MELLSTPLSLGPAPPADKPGSDLQQAAEAFEGAFLQILLKSMRKTIPDGGLFNRQQMEAFEEMQDRELADSLASRGALGIADSIVRQLGGAGPATPTSAQRTDQLSGISGAPSLSAAVAAPAVSKDSGQIKDRFVRELWPAAQRVAGRLKVSAQVLVAQAALETGWGQHVPKTGDGQTSNNLFGIKAGSDWSGEKAWNRTTEFLGGSLRQVVAGFRAYRSVEDSVADYADLISQSPRYRAALEATTDQGYLQSIQESGYATDPEYATKIGAILDDPVFRNMTSAQVNPAAGGAR